MSIMLYLTIETASPRLTIPYAVDQRRDEKIFYSVINNSIY
jgi:hypothetical protein